MEWTESLMDTEKDFGLRCIVHEQMLSFGPVIALDKRQWGTEQRGSQRWRLCRKWTYESGEAGLNRIRKDQGRCRSLEEGV